jgi:hypothetical protein
MRLCFLVGSVIKVSDVKFSYMDSRSNQSTEERARQTVTALNSIFLKHPNAKVYLIEGSLGLDMETLKRTGILEFCKYHNVEIVLLSSIDYATCVELNKHANKSYCEAILYKCFLDKFKSKLKEYDYVIKLSGRYSLTKNCKRATLKDTNAVYLKKIQNFKNEKKEPWAHLDILIPNQPLHDLMWTASFLLIFGKKRLDDFDSLLNTIIKLTIDNNACKDSWFNEKSTEEILQYWSWKNNINHKTIDWQILAYKGKDSGFWLF